MRETEDNDNFCNNILWSDEATFSNLGVFNRKNTHFWAQQNPHLSIERRNQHRFGFNVWCGILGTRIIGPIVYNGSLTGERYLHFLANDVEDILEELPVMLNNRIWFQQDGAPAHNSVAVRNYLSQRFNDRVIATHSDVRWPPRSPDLTPLDFFLWGYVKNKVFGIVNYQDVQELERAVLDAINNIDRRTLGKVTKSIKKRCQKCIERNGEVFEHYL